MVHSFYPDADLQYGPQLSSEECNASWQHFEITLIKHPSFGFGIAISGGCDNPHFVSGDSSIVVSDVVEKGPAFGLLQVNDRITSVNKISFIDIDYLSAVNIIKISNQLKMIVKRRVPLPLIELEQRTLKFTLSKSRKKDDFGIVLGCKFYIKQITNPKLAEKDPGLKEGDSVLRINGQSLEDISLEEATRWLQKSKEKLSLVVQRDVKRGAPGSRWPSQTTVYERLGSVNATPRHSPSPMLQNYFVPEQQLQTNTQLPNSLTQPKHPKLEDSENYNPTDSMYSSSQYGSHLGSSKKESQLMGTMPTTSNCSSPGLPPHSYIGRDKRMVVFRKAGNNLGIRVIGGNQVGVWVSAIQEGSPAAIHGMRVGDKIVNVNNFTMGGLTREQAVNYLLSINEEVKAQLEYLPQEFEHARLNQMGDSFYIRTHFQHIKSKDNKEELSFDVGDIFHVSDTLFGGSIGNWQVSRIYSATDEDKRNDRTTDRTGIIPNANQAQILAKQEKVEYKSFAGTLFRKKLQSKKAKHASGEVMEASNEAWAMPAYERVSLRRPPFMRPIILFGPLADIGRQLLLTNYSYCFGGTEDDKQIRLSSIDCLIGQNKHAVLNISPESVEKLSLAQYAPIVILIDIDSRSRVKELRQRAGGIHISSKKLIEQSNKLKKRHGHLLSATLDATKEDGWFEALRQLIIHLQDRSVWMPEHRPAQGVEELVLHGYQDSESEEVGEYGAASDYTIYGGYGSTCSDLNETKMRSNYDSLRKDKAPVARTMTESFLTPLPREPPRRIHNGKSYQETYTNSMNRNAPSNRGAGMYDINQILQETYKDRHSNDYMNTPLKESIKPLPVLPIDRSRSPLPFKQHHQDNGNKSGDSESTDKSSTSSVDHPISNKKNNNVPPNEPTVIEHVSGVMDHTGGKLICPESGVQLIVPECAVPKDKHQEIYVKICKDSLSNPPLNHEKEKLLSPLVMCGPAGTTFLRPLELRLPRNPSTDSTIEAINNYFVLKSSSGDNWKNIDVKDGTNESKYVSVALTRF
uniref:Tight junction protein ZO-1 n=1 Tax=Rhabditophanes sp. KR3021 TaxID=114890 RepID=A0AC35TZI5_9BILA